MQLSNIPNPQSEFKSIVKDSVIIALCIVIMVILLSKSCGKKESEPNQTTVYDTIYKQERLDTIYTPKLLTRYLRPDAPKVFEKWDTLYIEQLKDVDTSEILRDYNSFLIYKDTVRNKYGYVVINDTLTMNRIVSRGVITELKVPEVTKTVTLSQPKRAALFIGGGVFGNQKDLAAGYDVNVAFKTRGDKIIEIGYSQFFGGQGYFSLGYKHKISFNKK